MILYAVCHEKPENRTLSSVRDYLTFAPEEFAGLLKLMQASCMARGLIARAANRHLGKSDREAATTRGRRD
jgi:type IV secretion system protein VirD4